MTSNGNWNFALLEGLVTDDIIHCLRSMAPLVVKEEAIEFGGCTPQ